MENEKPRIHYAVISIVLVIAAILLASSAQDILFRVSTHRFTAHIMIGDAVNPQKVMYDNFKLLLPVYLKGAMIPALLLLLPAVVLMALFFGDGFKNTPRAGNFLKKGKNEAWFLAAVFLTYFLIAFAVNQAVLLDFPLSNDEFAYLYQADILAEGKLYAESPPMPDFFKFTGIIFNHKTYSKYTIGWPLLLALAGMAGLRSFTAPFLAAGSLVLLYLILKRLHSPTAGIIGVFLAAVSPFFLFQGASYYPHIAAGFFALLLIYSLLQMRQTKSAFYQVLCAVSVIMLLQVRPGDAGVVIMGLAPFTFYLFYKKNRLKTPFLNTMFVILSFCVGVAILMLVNRIQTGDPFLFAFMRHGPHEKWGFGTMGHGALRGLWNLFVTIVHGGMWTAPFTLLFAVAAALGARWKIRLVLIPVLGSALFYFFYYAVGSVGFGPRYYFTAYVVLLIPAAAGAVCFRDFCSAFLKRKTCGAFFVSLIVLASVFMTFSRYTRIVPVVRGFYHRNAKFLKTLKELPGVKERSLTFIMPSPDESVSIFNRNGIDLQNQKNVLVLFLMPEENRRLMSHFPSRAPYIVFFDNRQKRYRLGKYPQNDVTAQNYFVAGLNYFRNLNDLDKTEQAFDKAMKLDPDNPWIPYMLGKIYYDSGKYEKAVKAFDRIGKKGANVDLLYYYKGISLAKTGRKKEAARMLQFYVSRFPGSSKINQAGEWLRMNRQR